MKSSKTLRTLIRKILSEEMLPAGVGAGINAGFQTLQFHGYPAGVQNFPYGDAKLPEDMGKDEDVENEDVQKSFGDFAHNSEVYQFPMEKFQKGIEIETNKNNTSNPFDIAQKVLNNLQSDKTFYDKTR